MGSTEEGAERGGGRAESSGDSTSFLREEKGEGILRTPPKSKPPAKTKGERERLGENNDAFPWGVPQISTGGGKKKKALRRSEGNPAKGDKRDLPKKTLPCRTRLREQSEKKVKITEKV